MEVLRLNVNSLLSEANGLERQFSPRRLMLTSEKPTSKTTLLDSTTFFDHTEKNSVLSGEFEVNFGPGGLEFVQTSN